MEIELTLEEQIYQLENRLLQPEIRRSKDEISMLLEDDFIEFGSSGRIFNKMQVVEELPLSQSVQMNIEDFEIKILSHDVVLATYRIVKPNELRDEIKYTLRSSIWKFINGRWQLIFHQGTKTVDC